MEIKTRKIQCSARDEVMTDGLSFSSAPTSKVMKGLRINPFRIISRMAVTLVNNTQIPISDLGIMRTMKKRFRKPKNTTEILFSKENAPFENQREYAIEANV